MNHIRNATSADFAEILTIGNGAARAYRGMIPADRSHGTRLLRHGEANTDKPILIGTWAAASWAIDFYERNRFTLVPAKTRNRLLRSCWSIPDRQIETSVVLANSRWSREAQT